MGQSALAQTSDGETPANEGICDPLTDDGVTQGLYGLCIAFCEAQDHADILTAITDGDYDALLDAAPSGKILANYNAKKTDNDPAMPCVTIDNDSCPCWSEDEFLNASLVGVRDGEATDNRCGTGIDGAKLYQLASFANPIAGVVAREDSNGVSNCAFVDYQNEVFRNFVTSPSAFGLCRDRILARQLEFGITPSSTSNDYPFCFDSQATQ